MAEAHERYRGDAGGATSNVYPALAQVAPELFGICVIGTSGSMYAAGDCEVDFTIMSVAKPFVFALACDAAGARGGVAEDRRERHRIAIRLAGGRRAQR